MKTLGLLFVTIIMFSGSPRMEAQQPIPAKVIITAPIDSLKINYFKEIDKTEKLTDQLIAKKKDVDNENTILKAEIKRLRKINEYLRQNIDTVYIHDTTFKKRRFLQLFKK